MSIFKKRMEDIIFSETITASKFFLNLNGMYIFISYYIYKKL